MGTGGVFEGRKKGNEMKLKKSLREEGGAERQ